MNDKNLVPINSRTKSKQREIQSKGGLVSAQNKRDRINLRKCMEMLLEEKYKDDNGKLVSGAELISIKQLQRAMQGNTKAFEVVRDTAGQKPADKVEISKPDSEVIDEINNYVK